MASHYKLLFRGAVHKGQHAAVVRPKLQALLKASDAQMEVMFSGKPVTIKKAVEEAVAERYINAFIDVGAKLELVEVAAPVAAAPAPQSEPAPASAPTTTTTTEAEADGAFQLAEAGATLADASAKDDRADVVVSTDHLSLASAGTTLGESESVEAAPAPAVDTSHLQLDQPGVRLGVPESPAGDIDLLLNVDFELGEVGETLVEAKPQVEAELPDISHLQVESTPVS